MLVFIDTKQACVTKFVTVIPVISLDKSIDTFTLCISIQNTPFCYTYLSKPHPHAAHWHFIHLHFLQIEKFTESKCFLHL